MKNLLVLILFFCGSAYAEVKQISMEERKQIDQTLRIFNLASERPELWGAILDDLKPFKENSGKEKILKYFEGRYQKALEKYGKEFVRQAEKYQEKAFKKNEKEINEHIAEAKKVFGNVNKETTKKSWEHMVVVKSDILPYATTILEEAPELNLMRQKVSEMGKIVKYFEDGEFMDLKIFEEFVISRSITFADSKARKIMEENESAKVPLDIKRGVRDLNVMRLIFGMNALMIDEKLCACSADHSKDMKEKGFFAHESPVAGKKTPWDRARNFGTNASGENIAMGSNEAKGSNRQWYLSPGHFSNMFSGKNRVGLGNEANYWTQMLGN